MARAPSVSRQLVFAVAVPLVLSFALTVFVLDHLFRDSAIQALQDRLDQEVVSLVTAAELTDSGRMDLRLLDPESRLSRPRSGQYAAVRSARGRVLWNSPSTEGVAIDYGAPVAIGRSAFFQAKLADGAQRIDSGYLNGLAGRSAVVIGAGSMGALAAAHLVRAGVGRIHVVNRSLPRAERLVQNLRDQGVDAHAFPFDHIPPVLTDADVVVSCTGAVRPVVSLADVHRGLAHGQEPKQLVICDLGMPRDVDPAVAGLPGVFMVDMDRIQREPSARAAASDAEAAKSIVASEVANYLAGQRMAEVTPTVTALRQRAADVVEAELLRLDNRLPGLEATQRDEVARTVRRVVDKLLHAPTVRVKQLASAPGGDSYAEALRELFELDQHAVDAVAGSELPRATSDYQLDVDGTE